MAKIRKLCNSCGSSAVKKDAWVAWDEEKQEWVLDRIHDDEHAHYCEDCEQLTDIFDEEIKE